MLAHSAITLYTMLTVGIIIGMLLRGPVSRAPVPAPVQDVEPEADGVQSFPLNIGESIRIGDDLVVKVLGIEPNGMAKLSIDVQKKRTARTRKAA